MSTKKKLLLVVIIILLLIIIYSIVNSFLKSNKAKIKPAVSVSVSTVVQKNVTEDITAIGNVQAYSTIAVTSLVDGQMLSVGFKEGDFVAANQLLFQIDPRPFQAQLKQAQADLARDQAQLENVQQQVKRNSKLAKSGYLAQQDYDTLQANAKTLAATVLADKAEINTAQLQLEYSTIRAPIAGRTGNLLVHPGNLVKSSDSNALVTINQVNPIYISFTLPEQELSRIQQQLKKGNVEVTAIINKTTNLIEKGKITFVNNTVDTTTGTIQLKATFDNQGHQLWPGQFVAVAIPIAHIENALLVPTVAIQAGQKGSFVFVVESDNTAHLQMVEPGPVIGENTLILKGMKAGQQVVTAGQMRLVDKTPVTIFNRLLSKP